jgi:uncharacterized protein with ParB-like and HNH nuclease domain
MVMKAQGENLLTVLGHANRQFRVPLFQRPYVWDADEWEQLWEDLQSLVTTPSSPPLFLGAVVTQQGDGAFRDVQPWIVVDGQQRLTTFSLLLKALHDELQDLDAGIAANLGAAYLRNLGARKLDLYRLLPTEEDQGPFRAVMDCKGLDDLEQQKGFERPKPRRTDRRHRMVRGYRYFVDQLRALVSDLTNTEEKVQGLNRLKSVLAQRVQVVDVVLDHQDNAQTIFETLNARGVDLRPSDLVRNLLFQQAVLEEPNDAEALYTEYWRDFDRGEKGQFWQQTVAQGRRYRARFDLFLQHFLTLQLKREASVSRLYDEFKNWLVRERKGVTTAAVLTEIRSCADVFASLSSEWANGLLPRDARAVHLYRFQELDIGTMSPFVMRLLLAERADPKLTPEVDGILQDLESYVIRRMICGISSKNFNQFFPGLYERIAAKGAVTRSAFRAELLGQSGTLAWPSDSEFAQAWMERRAYQGGATAARVRVVLEALELQLRTGKQERLDIADRLQVEHLLPQEWRPHYASCIQDEDEWYLDTLGNLTLLTQKLNASISNGPFFVPGAVPAGKQPEILRNSRLELNVRFLDKLTRWDVAAIRSRGEALFQQALAIWPRPVVEAASSVA